MPTADIAGPQRKVIESSVRPARASQGTSGIPIRGGRTQPFVVARVWSAPAGRSPEGFYLIDPTSREVLFEGRITDKEILGLQARTEIEEVVNTPLSLEPGSYAIVFACDGLSGGEFPVEAFDVPSVEAA